jgi:hypothetical protein
MAWLRRNRWGLVALVPVLAAIVALQWGDVYDRYWGTEARDPVTAGPDGWVSFAGARIRLADLGPGTDLKTYGGEPFRPPAGTAVWRATVSFAAPRPDRLNGCAIRLTDSAGRVYQANPSDLEGARTGFVSCTPSTSDEGSTEYDVTAYFLTPDESRPSAVRITVSTQYPRYALLRL